MFCHPLLSTQFSTTHCSIQSYRGWCMIGGPRWLTAGTEPNKDRKNHRQRLLPASLSKSKYTSEWLAPWCSLHFCLKMNEHDFFLLTEKIFFISHLLFLLKWIQWQLICDRVCHPLLSWHWDKTALVESILWHFLVSEWGISTSDWKTNDPLCFSSITTSL